MPSLTISAPGTYHITSDYTQADPNDNAIYITPGTHYVTILLSGRLVGAGGPGGNNAGIYAPYSAALTVIGLGGSIRGFSYGVRGDNNYIARISDLFVQDGYFRGIGIYGDDIAIDRCDIRNITGATWTPNAYSFGIEVQGLAPDGHGKPKVARCNVQDVYGTGTGESVGISISDRGIGGVVSGNTVKNSTMKPGSFGLWVGGNSNVAVTHNLFDTWANGGTFSSPPGGFLDENAFRNVTNPISSGANVVRGDGVNG
jgi:hypothetical protein